VSEKTNRYVFSPVAGVKPAIYALMKKEVRNCCFKGCCEDVENIMKIDCYLSLLCGAENDLRENILSALTLEEINAEMNFYRINDSEALDLGLRGSPSILINGEEIQPVEEKGFS
jgi:hypothetical protein